MPPGPAASCAGWARGRRCSHVNPSAGVLGFDAFLTGQWDSLGEMADEAISLCDGQGYGLLRWPLRSLQALLAAGRGDSANVRAITDEVIGWAVPRKREK